MFTDYDPGVLTRCEGNRDETLKALGPSAPASLANASFSNLAWGDSSAASSLASEGKFDLLLGSDVIYDSDIVGPLFETVAGLLHGEGKFVMTQSFVYDAATEARIDECVQAKGLQREVLR